MTQLADQSDEAIDGSISEPSLSTVAQHATTVSDVFRAARKIYRHGNPFQKLLLLGRPLISPFHVLADQVPRGSTLLDVGCGSGLFVNLLLFQERISRGMGFDSSSPAIYKAIEASREYSTGGQAQFRQLAVKAGLPKGTFDVVSMIDVLHHIPPAAQRDAVERALAKVAPGGLFLFKDIGVRPLWRAWANRLHDLVLARQWVNYVALDDIAGWALSRGFVEERRQTINMLWYGHELLVLRRPASGQPLAQPSQVNAGSSEWLDDEEVAGEGAGAIW